MARVAIVGAGVSGLTSIKACLEEGLRPTCYEMSGDIGGLWCYGEVPEEGKGSVMDSTIFNSSKESSGLSDFPPPKDIPAFPGHKHLLAYLKSYASHFNLGPYIRTNTRVTKVCPKDGTGWSVTTQSENQEKTEEFDAVMVATGHQGIPLFPDIPSLSRFQGRVLHSHDYRHPRGLEDTRVLVVGLGDSGGDIAVELSRLCPEVYLSVRNGAWIVPRVGPFGLPYDRIYLSRILNWCFNYLPYGVWNSIIEFVLTFYFNHHLYRIKPRHRVFDQTPTVNDSLANRIIAGRIVVKGDIREVTEKGVIFEDDRNETPLDVIIFATGYKMAFPFLPDSIEVVPNHVNACYKMTFPPDFQTLAFVGLYQPIGPVWPLVELQSRWIAAVLSGRVSLPSTSEMKKATQKDLERRARRFGTSACHANHCDHINFMDDLGEMLGVSPPLWRMLFTDFNLFLCCVLGPNTGYQFRLRGPHAWSGARDAICKTTDRLYAHFKTRLPHPDVKKESLMDLSSFFLVSFFLFFLFIGSIIFVMI